MLTGMAAKVGNDSSGVVRLQGVFFFPPALYSLILSTFPVMNMYSFLQQEHINARISVSRSSMNRGKTDF